MAFRDQYTNFWFDDISSETMKVWITNSRDLKFHATPKFSDAFVSPTVSQTRYHTGTTISNQEFTVKCLAINVNMLEWRAIQNWLSPLRVGKLSFDFNDWTYYLVKVSKEISGTTFINGYDHAHGDNYTIEFTITFTTVNDWAALGPTVTIPLNKVFNGGAVDKDYLTNKTFSLETAINNKYYMPAVYNKTVAANPASVKTTPSGTRKYLVEPTIVSNTVIYFDDTIPQPTDAGALYAYRLYYLDSVGETATALMPRLYGTISWSLDDSGAISGPFFDLVDGSTEQISHGINCLGLSLLFVPLHKRGTINGDNIVSPFYIWENANTYAIMNCGAYETYPNLSLDLGVSNLATVDLEGVPLYSYTSNFYNTVVQIHGHSGTAIVGDSLAEYGVVKDLRISSGTYASNPSLQTPVIADSYNYGPLVIPSGNPELLKIRIFDCQIPSLDGGLNTNNVTQDKHYSHGVIQFIFQPVGEFQQLRTGPTAIMLFTQAAQEQQYNTGIYPFADSYNTSNYGSTVHDKFFTLNGFISQVEFKDDNEVPYTTYVLTIPTLELFSESESWEAAPDEDKDANAHILKKVVWGKAQNPYLYLSLCNTTNLSITVNNAVTSYMSIHTRDAL